MFSEHLIARRLVRFRPVMDPDESEVRELLMLPALHSWLYQSDRKKTLDYKANIRAHLGVFVKGKWIDNCEYMKHLRDDVWEFRVQLQKKKENTRIFGAFADADLFVCTHQKSRGALNFAAAIQRVKNDWDGLFPGCHRVRSRPFSNCVTNNFDDCA